VEDGPKSMFASTHGLVLESLGQTLGKGTTEPQLNMTSQPVQISCEIIDKESFATDMTRLPEYACVVCLLSRIVSRRKESLHERQSVSSWNDSDKVDTSKGRRPAHRGPPCPANSKW
jgi:hypothetical protein